MTDTPNTYGRPLYLGVLIFVSLLSVAGNAVYAYAAPVQSGATLPPGWAAAAHVVPPVILLLVTEVLATASTQLSGRGRSWALAGVVVIAGAAFTLSFDALFEVARMAKVRAELAWLVPVMLDTAIIVCTVLVLMASRQIQRDRVSAGHPRISADTSCGVRDAVSSGHLDTPTDSQNDTAADTRNDTTNAVSAEATDSQNDTVVDSQNDRRPDSQDAVSGGVRDVMSFGVSTPADLGVDSDDTVVSPVMAAAVGTVTEAVTDTVIASVAAAPADTVTGPVTRIVDTPDTPAEYCPADTLDLSAVTTAVIAEVGTSADPDTIERALRLHLAEGLSGRKIAEIIGVSRTPVAAWIKTAKSLDAEYAARTQPQLTGVGAG